MGQIGVLVYAELVGSQTILKTTILLIQNGGVKIYHGSIDGIQQIIDDLVNLDEDNILLLLCALPRSFMNFKDIMIYAKEGSVTLDELKSFLRTKELTKLKYLKMKSSEDSLNV